MDSCKVALVSADISEVPEWVPRKLADRGIDLVGRKCGSRADLLETAADADIIWLFGANRTVTAEVLPELKRCGAVLRTGSGTDDIPIAAATSLGIIVANTPSAIAEAVADHAIALLFAVTRHISVQDRAVRAGIWDFAHSYPAHHFSGSRLGLVSFGRIARHVAEKLSGFKMNIAAYDPFLSSERIAACGVEPVSLDELLESSDFISLHCPLSDETRGLIGEAELNRMKPGAILINTSRGPVIDEAALTKALQTGRIAGAGLDVLAQEPPERDNPLLKLDNVVITPHIAAYSDQFKQNFWEHSVMAIADLAARRWPESYVNRDVKPKWQMAEPSLI